MLNFSSDKLSQLSNEISTHVVHLSVEWHSRRSIHVHLFYNIVDARRHWSTCAHNFIKNTARRGQSSFNEHIIGSLVTSWHHSVELSSWETFIGFVSSSVSVYTSDVIEFANLTFILHIWRRHEHEHWRGIISQLRSHTYTLHTNGRLTANALHRSVNSVDYSTVNSSDWPAICISMYVRSVDVADEIV